MKLRQTFQNKAREKLSFQVVSCNLLWVKSLSERVVVQTARCVNSAQKIGVQHVEGVHIRVGAQRCPSGIK